jgi:hypothetical protein
MRAIGAAGGRGSVRSRLGLSDEVADEGLREKARRRLEKVLDGDDEAAALRAAQSLYSYRAAQPPADHRRREGEDGVYLASGRKVVSLADVLELCLEAKGIYDDARLQDVVLRAAEHVRELQAGGVRVEATRARHTPSPKRETSARVARGTLPRGRWREQAAARSHVEEGASWNDASRAEDSF